MPNLSPKNRFLILLIIFFLFVNAPWVYAMAGGSIKCKAIGLISPSQAIKCMLDEYGLNENTLKETAKYLDVSNLKKQAPKVTLTFTPSNPTLGEEATATAETIYFSNDPDALYFTWYLQPEYCREEKLDEEVNGVKNRHRCNLNNDHDKDGTDIVDIEDFKIKAMRIYANAGYDWETTDYTVAVQNDDDGYEAVRGGEDQKDKTPYCYFYDTTLGKQYLFKECFHLFPNGYNPRTGSRHTTGDDSFGKEEEEAWRTNPDDPDTADTGHMDEANVTGLGAKTFTWTYQTGDRVGVVVEGVAVDPTPYEDSSYKIMWAVPNNTCGDLEEYIDEDELGGGEEEDTEVSPTVWPDLPDGGTFTRTLIKKIQIDSEQAPSSSYQMKTYKVFTKTEEITLASRRRVAGSATATGGTGGSAPTGGSASVTINTTTLPRPTAPDCNTFDTYNQANYSLVNAGFVTQAQADSNVRYRVALATNSACCPPSTALSDGTTFCSAITTISETESTELDIDPEDSIFTMTEEDFNKCLLEENLLTPAEGGGKNEKIEVSLSYSPTNPVNDTNTLTDADTTNDAIAGDSADWISVVSTIENSTKNESLNYTWYVYAGQNSDTDADWGDPLSKDRLGQDAKGNNVVEQTTGAGLSSLKFKANFDETTPDVSGTDMVPKYLKVKLNVSEKVTSGTGTTDAEKGVRKGLAEVIIQLSSSANKLTVQRATVDEDLVLSAATTVLPDREICQTEIAQNTLVDAAICQVAPDEIIAVKADVKPEPGSTETLANFNFLWTLNGQQLSYKYDPDYIQADFEPGNLIYFPVLAAKGSTLNLSLTATSQDSGRKISLTKTFLVSEPAFKIISTDESTSKPKTLGYYTDLDDEDMQYPDYSQTEFLALEDSSVALELAPFASFPFPDTEDLPIKWYWNDTLLTDEGYNLPAFPTTDLDTSFSLKAEGVYTQDRNTKRALRDYWDVALDEYYERLISQTVDFTLAASIDGATTAQKGQGKILASFISSVPAYFAFLFRLVMTAFVLLSAIWILFALFPQMQKND